MLIKGGMDAKVENKADTDRIKKHKKKKEKFCDEFIKNFSIVK